MHLSRENFEDLKTAINLSSKITDVWPIEKFKIEWDAIDVWNGKNVKVTPIMEPYNIGEKDE